MMGSADESRNCYNTLRPQAYDFHRPDKYHSKLAAAD